jgi:hypothetical protein
MSRYTKANHHVYVAHLFQKTLNTSIRNPLFCGHGQPEIQRSRSKWFWNTAFAVLDHRSPRRTDRGTREWPLTIT